jgi:hypothetical protein
MAIDRLSSAASLIAALRAEVTRKSEKSSRRSSAETASSIQKSHDARRRDAAALRRELAEILKDVSPNDEEAMDAARPRVIRAVLLWEFGPELREYGEWQPMLDTLVRTSEGDQRHRQEFVALIRELCA